MFPQISLTITQTKRRILVLSFDLTAQSVTAKICSVTNSQKTKCTKFFFFLKREFHVINLDKYMIEKSIGFFIIGDFCIKASGFHCGRNNEKLSNC